MRQSTREWLSDSLVDMAEQAGIDCAEGRLTDRQHLLLLKRLERASILVSQGPSEPAAPTTKGDE